MATSGTYNFSVTRDDIIRQAMLNIQRLDPDEPPSSSEVVDCARVLNMMCKQWQGKTDFAPGLKVWTQKHGHLFLSTLTGRYLVGPAATGWTENYTQTTALAATTNTLTLASTLGLTPAHTIGVQDVTGNLEWFSIISIVGSVVTLNTLLSFSVGTGAVVFYYLTPAQQPLFLVSAVLRDLQLNDTPLRMMTIQTYDNLPSKANLQNSGDPTSVYYETQLDNSYLYTDVACAQDVTKHIAITYMQAIQDFNNPLDTPYFPQEWYLALCWGLAEQIAPMFKAQWTPKMDNLKVSAINMAKQKDAERTELFFQPGEDGT